MKERDVWKENIRKVGSRWWMVVVRYIEIYIQKFFQVVHKVKSRKIFSKTRKVVNSDNMESQEV